MGLSISAGIAAATGFQEGRQAAINTRNAEEDRLRAIANADEDRAYTRSQRAYQAGQQARTVADQQRVDTRRVADAAIQTTRSVAKDFRDPTLPQVDDDGNPSAAALPAIGTETFQVPKEEQIRMMASNAKTEGNMEAFLKMSQAADQLEGKRVSAQFADLLGSSKSMSAVDLGASAAKIWSSTTAPLQVSNVRPFGNGGVSIDLLNRDTGTKTTRDYATKEEFLAGVQALAQPETFAAQLAEARKLQLQTQAKLQAKPVTTVPGGYVDNKDGTFYPTVFGGGSGGAGGTGSGKGGKGGDDGSALAQARSMLASKAEKSLEKLDGDVWSRAEIHLEQLYQSVPNAPPAAAAYVARAVAKDPTLMKPTLNHETGELDGVYRDKSIAGGKPFVLAPNWMTPEEAQKAFPDDKTGLAKMVLEMLQAQGVGVSRQEVVDGKMVKTALTPDEAKQVRDTYLKAAFDADAAEALAARIRSVSGEAGEAALRRKLELIRTHLSPEGGVRGQTNRASFFQRAIGGITRQTGENEALRREIGNPIRQPLN